MCGIGGILSFGNTQVHKDDLDQMGRFMEFRGPDHMGVWLNEHVGFVHRRLSIIDLSAAAHQPMFDYTGSAMISFNGEIYNYQEIKKELLNSGVNFITNSDTEVIVNGYKHWGIEKLVKKIDGMFAFAIYDFTLRKLFLVRDRFGKKPLYYCKNSDYFCFSSDIRSLLKFLPKKEIDLESLDYYLSELTVPQPKTIYKNISQVNKSAYLEINCENVSVDQKTYWKPDFTHKLKIDFSEAEKLIEKALEKAILKRMMADVPVGCFLSGGIDSGLIVSILASNMSKPVNTFTVGFAERDYDESEYARQLAKRYNTNHTELLITPNIREDLFELIDYFGEPFADSSAIPTYYICKAMKECVTVALSGDGGDELFGYKSYAYTHQVETFIRENPGTFVRWLKVNFSKIKGRFIPGSNLGSFLHNYKNIETGYMLKRGMSFSSEEKKRLMKPEYLYGMNEYTDVYLQQAWSKYQDYGLTDNIFLASMDTRLLNDYLVKVDRASMRNSLEVRSPFLDTDLMQLSGKIPNEYKVNNGMTKVVLRSLAKKYIDPDINSRKKQGFGVPVGHWLKHELKDIVSDTFSKENVAKRGYFEYAFIKELIDQHNSGLANNTHKIWSLLWFEFWCRKYMD